MFPYQVLRENHVPQSDRLLLQSFFNYITRCKYTKSLQYTKLF